MQCDGAIQRLSLLVFWPTNLLFWFSLTVLISFLSRCSRQLFSLKDSDKPSTPYLLTNKQWQKKRQQAGEHSRVFRGKRPDISLRWRLKTELDATWRMDFRWPETPPQMDDNVVLYLLMYKKGTVCLYVCHINLKGDNMSSFSCPQVAKKIHA